MTCKNTCKLCDRLVLSQSVTFDDVTNTLSINLPAGEYKDCCKYCIVIAQTIPTDTTISALVNITIGEGTETYPLVKNNCAQVTACGVRNRTKYCTVVDTNTTGGVFKLIGNVCCEPDNSLTGLTGTTPTTPA